MEVKMICSYCGEKLGLIDSRKEFNDYDWIPIHQITTQQNEYRFFCCRKHMKKYYKEKTWAN